MLLDLQLTFSRLNVIVQLIDLALHLADLLVCLAELLSEIFILVDELLFLLDDFVYSLLIILRLDLEHLVHLVVLLSEVFSTDMLSVVLGVVVLQISQRQLILGHLLIRLLVVLGQVVKVFNLFGEHFGNE